MELSSPTQVTGGVMLDSPPPQPSFSRGPGPPPKGLGDMASSPQLMTMQGLAMAKDAFQLIANGLPAISQLLSNTIADLEKLVAQASADAMAGTQPAITPGGPGLPTPTPPMPPAGPPGGPPMGGAGPMMPGGMMG